MANTRATIDTIPGTYIFDGAFATKGYALNKMCYSFNDAASRAEFKRDEDAYCAKFGLSAEQREAIRKRDVLALLARDSASRLPMRLTATKNASSPARPASVSAAIWSRRCPSSSSTAEPSTVLRRRKYVRHWAI